MENFLERSGIPLYDGLLTSQEHHPPDSQYFDTDILVECILDILGLLL